MNNQDKENKPSFICYNCKQENFYNLNDYINKNNSTELLMERVEKPKKKDVIIYCNNDDCKAPNTITINY